MRFLVVPPDVRVDGLPYSFEKFLTEHVWVHPQWRNAANLKLKLECVALFLGKKAGDIVAFQGNVFEAFEGIATFQGERVSPKFDLLFTPFFTCIVYASAEDPEEKKKEDAIKKRKEEEEEAAKRKADAELVRKAEAELAPRAEAAEG